MFQVTGLLQNCFKQDATDKYDESFKIQILGDHVQQNGELRQELLTLTVPRNVYREFESLKGRSVTLPVGLFVNGNRVQAFIPKGSNLTAPKASGGGLPQSAVAPPRSGVPAARTATPGVA